MGAPPLSDEGNVGSVAAFAPPWAYVFSWLVM